LLLESHRYLRFLAHLPLSFEAFVLRSYNLGFLKKESRWLYSRIIFEDTRLSNSKEYIYLFDEGKVMPKRGFFLIRSYIATNLNQIAYVMI
jgi:hypothetical protein